MRLRISEHFVSPWSWAQAPTNKKTRKQLTAHNHPNSRTWNGTVLTGHRASYIAKGVNIRPQRNIWEDLPWEDIHTPNRPMPPVWTIRPHYLTLSRWQCFGWFSLQLPLPATCQARWFYSATFLVRSSHVGYHQSIYHFPWSDRRVNSTETEPRTAKTTPLLGRWSCASGSVL